MKRLVYDGGHLTFSNPSHFIEKVSIPQKMIWNVSTEMRRVAKPLSVFECQNG